MKATDEMHLCQIPEPEVLTGPVGQLELFGSIYWCEERENEDGEKILWVRDGSHGTRVDYCPFCGYEAEDKKWSSIETETDAIEPLEDFNKTTGDSSE